MGTIPQSIYEDAHTLWEYHHIHQPLEPCSVGIGLGSLDIEVAAYTAELFHQKFFPRIVFSGAISSITRDRFPEGEAIAYRRKAIQLGVPPSAILIETRATNTEENIQFSRQLLDDHSIAVDSILFICRPSQERRAYAICKRLWPEPYTICTSPPMTLDHYFSARGEPKRVIDMLVGDTQRLVAYPKLGRAVPQDIPLSVANAYTRLVAAGFTSRLLPDLY